MPEIFKFRENFRNGFRIYHSTYGYGTIDDCDDDDVYVIFDNNQGDFSGCFKIDYLINCNDVKLFPPEPHN